SMQKVTAARGAVQIKSDKIEDIQFGVVSLYNQIMQQNNLEIQDVISLIISQTDDLVTANPAFLLRKAIPAIEIPLFCVQECKCENSMPRVIRYLLHVNVQEGTNLHHIYIHGAEKLRPDIPQFQES
ncbi:MAG: chorismate mutase, partial [Bacteroidales bacterium]|nr:chorismate mutase [Bacteroidales bacterium]